MEILQSSRFLTSDEKSTYQCRTCKRAIHTVEAGITRPAAPFFRSRTRQKMKEILMKKTKKTEIPFLCFYGHNSKTYSLGKSE